MTQNVLGATSSRRSRFEVAADLLRHTKPAGFTRLMYSANLSYRLACRYINSLVDRKYLVLTSDGLYVVTPEGIEYRNKVDALTETS